MAKPPKPRYARLMAHACCEGKSEALALLREKQGRVLRVVLGINAGMFIVEAASGWIAGSTALLADSLDMLGDAAVYAFSLYALHRSERWRAGAGLMKGLVMVAFGLVVLAEAAHQAWTGATPSAHVMGGVGALALTMNALCLYLLWTHRSDDVNMRSTWLCSRNDIIANVSVIAAAVLVSKLGSAWPDTVIGTGIAALFLASGVSVIRDARSELSQSARVKKHAPGSASA